MAWIGVPIGVAASSLATSPRATACNSMRTVRGAPASMTSDSCSIRSRSTGVPAGVWRSGSASATRAAISTRFTECACSGSGIRGLGGGRLAGFLALDRLHHDGRLGVGVLGLDEQVAQDRVVVAERVLELIQRGLAAFDVEAHVVGLHELLDGVGELAAAPVLDAVDLAAIAGDHGLEALEHGGALLALLGTLVEHNCVVGHVSLLVDICDVDRQPAG